MCEQKAIFEQMFGNMRNVHLNMQCSKIMNENKTMNK